MMTKKIVLELEADASVWERAERLAAQRCQPLERWIVEQVEEAMPIAAAPPADFDEARRRAIELLDKGLPLGGKPLSREEVHQRRL
jgi:hypothetical protein